MSRSLKLYIAGLVSISLIGLIVTSFAFAQRTDMVGGIRPLIAVVQLSRDPLAIWLGVALWTVMTLFAGALPVRMPRGSLVSVSMAPIIASVALGGPVAGGIVALVGSTELREIRGRVPWYGTAVNHAVVTLPAVACGLVI